MLFQIIRKLTQGPCGTTYLAQSGEQLESQHVVLAEALLCQLQGFVEFTQRLMATPSFSTCSDTEIIATSVRLSQAVKAVPSNSIRVTFPASGSVLTASTKLSATSSVWLFLSSQGAAQSPLSAILRMPLSGPKDSKLAGKWRVFSGFKGFSLQSRPPDRSYNNCLVETSVKDQTFVCIP